MKGAFAFLAAGLLALAVVAPASAVPSNNPHVLTWEINCPGLGLGDTFTETGSGVPGWSTARSPGDTPFLLMAAVFSQWQSGVEVVSGFHFGPWPRGLMTNDRLVGPCSLHVLGGSTATFDIVGTGAYFLVPAGK